MPLPLFIKPAGFGVVVAAAGDGIVLQIEDWLVFAASGVTFDVDGVVFDVS